jgi:uncharacterized protein (TIGR03032 family)
MEPFACTHTPEFPGILHELKCSLAVSTFQAGKLIFLSATPDGAKLVQLPRNFDKPMGVCFDGQRLAVATRNDVMVLANDARLAAVYPERPGYYDALFVPRAVYFSGELDLHDLAWAGEKLWAVNTRFSCLGEVNEKFSFVPRWKPGFISELCAEDRCHLNGMTFSGEKPEFATALGTANHREGWREHLPKGGALFHVPSGEAVLKDLAMPHSPRIYDGQLYLLLSASAELVKCDPRKGTYETVTRLPGFARGMSRLGDYLFIGISLLRSTHRFAGLPIVQAAPFCGVVIVHLPSGKVVGQLQYLNSCEEIYDVQVLPGMRRPGILRMDDPFRNGSLSMPETVFWTKPGDGSGAAGNPARA